MKIKRYFAKTASLALQMVRDDQGPDAVIMSNNKVDDGVELITAIDYDDNIFNNGKNIIDQKNYMDDTDINQRYGYAKENDINELKCQISSIKDLLEGQMASLAWHKINDLNPGNAKFIKRLVGMGFSEKLSTRLISKFNHLNDEKYIWRHLLAELVSLVPINNTNLINTGGIVALVGPTGVGKTTTIAKIAAKYAIQHGVRKVGLITIDNYRIAAYEQLKTYANIIDIPVRIAETNDDLDNILNDYYDKDLILIDTAGMGQYDNNIINQAAILDQNRFDIKKSLVISATTQYKAINDIIHSFSCYSVNDCIITKLDEAPMYGQVIDAVILNDLAISFVTNGQRVPEDIQQASPHRLISQCIAIGNKNNILPTDLMMAINYEDAI